MDVSLFRIIQTKLQKKQTKRHTICFVNHPIFSFLYISLKCSSCDSALKELSNDMLDNTVCLNLRYEQERNTSKLLFHRNCKLQLLISYKFHALKKDYRFAYVGVAKKCDWSDDKFENISRKRRQPSNSEKFSKLLDQYFLPL